LKHLCCFFAVKSGSCNMNSNEHTFLPHLSF
jgi:hypothetical protein